MLLCKTIIPSSRLKRILIVGQGPGLNDEKSNLGELYISFHFKNKTKTKFFKLEGNRDANINKAVKVSLEFISENLDK